MVIRNVAHRGLRRFIDRDDASGLDPSVVEKVRNIMSFLENMANVGELRSLAHWNAHRLSGNREGTWSLTVSRNWRITFRVDAGTSEIYDLDFEDYH